MKLLSLGLLAVAACAAADYSPTCAVWPELTVMTSEDLFRGSKYKGYPISAMLDGDPTTAWVFKSVPLRKDDLSTKDTWGTNKAIGFEFTKPILLDGIEIMNGYNKSVETFYRNDRVTALRVMTAENQAQYARNLVAKAKLEDYMGWQKIGLPRKRYSTLKLLFDEVARGMDRDLCISEIRFVLDGKPIDLRLPKAFMETSGSECGCGTTFHAATMDGKDLDCSDNISEGSTYGYSPDGRFVMGFESPQDLSENPKTPRTMRAWIVDTRTAKVLARKTLPWWDCPELKWKSGRQVQVWNLGFEADKKTIKF